MYAYVQYFFFLLYFVLLILSLLSKELRFKVVIPFPFPFPSIYNGVFPDGAEFLLFYVHIVTVKQKANLDF